MRHPFAARRRALPVLVDRSRTSCGRRSIGTTRQQARPALGPETTRGRCRATVLRAAPRLFGLSTAAALFHALPAAK